MRIGLVVEGHGDVAAAPIVVRRIIVEMIGGAAPLIERPMRIPKSKLVKAGELERAVDFLANQVGRDGAIVVLLDADDDLPCVLGPGLQSRAAAARRDRRIEVVVAKAEFEAWFIAAIESLAGNNGVDSDASFDGDCEAIRNAKGWLDERMSDGYTETLDQQDLARDFDLRASHARSPSFQKLVRSLTRLVRNT